jgi:hypothetical protein
VKTLTIAALLGASVAMPLAADATVGSVDGWIDKLTGPAGVALVSVYVIRELLAQIKSKDAQIERMVTAASREHDSPKT